MLASWPFLESAMGYINRKITVQASLDKKRDCTSKITREKGLWQGSSGREPAWQVQSLEFKKVPLKIKTKNPPQTLKMKT
jgi:hypothetical protein